MITIYPNTQEELTIVPSSLKWSLNDVSQADSGRDVKGKMYKNRITLKRKLEMEFKGFDWKEASKVCDAFTRNEYFDVNYPDILDGMLETRNFYRGDITTEAFVWWDGKQILATLKFNIIER